MLIGLFVIVARRKAITQVIGFLVFENGIAVFANGLMVHHGAIVELGILLDVFVLVFIMGIAVFKISREFQHIDADRLNSLRDRRDPDNAATPLTQAAVLPQE
jgi:hydrogenase-4 component E